MGKRKKDRMDRAMREAENNPTVRRLRELIAKGEAELAERRLRDPNAR